MNEHTVLAGTEYVEAKQETETPAITLRRNDDKNSEKYSVSYDLWAVDCAGLKLDRETHRWIRGYIRGAFDVIASTQIDRKPCASVGSVSGYIYNLEEYEANEMFLKLREIVKDRDNWVIEEPLFESTTPDRFKDIPTVE
ncbi:MAG: hypothetical protein SVU88_03505 [Candidatus Nanohaloarchaea archaeon]|nr:hypothetical protein [Candidatus Nanohaloarchaea archaeon]